MVSVGISKLGLTDLIFVSLEIKINGGYYWDVVLLQQLLPVMRDVSGDFFIFQQHGAPAHRARDTTISSAPAFIPPDLWPPNGIDFNPLKPSVITRLHFECSAPYRSNLPFLISDIRALWRSALSARVPECRKLTSSSAMAERPRELDQRFQVGVNFRLHYRLKGYFSRQCDMTQFTLTHHMVNKAFLLLGLAAEYRSRRWMRSTLRPTIRC